MARPKVYVIEQYSFHAGAWVLFEGRFSTLEYAQRCYQAYCAENPDQRFRLIQVLGCNKA